MPELTGRMLTVIDVPSCCGSPTQDETAFVACASAELTKFHFALNVSDLEQAVSFYRVLFNVPPAKHHHDYAKFELEQPPLVFSLVPQAPSSGGSLSHFGFPVQCIEEVAAAAERLASAGLEITCQTGTVCGDARQDKVWVADPDRNFWEIYFVYEDVDPETVRAAFDDIAPPVSTMTPVPNAMAGPSKIIWEHRVLVALPDRIPYADDTVDEVRLEGSFNDRLSEQERSWLLKEALRVLRPAGQLLVHGLVADASLHELPLLPGIAGIVQRIPEIQEPMREISKAGFETVRMTKLPEATVFRHNRVGFHEMKVEARKPGAALATKSDRMVLYKGPFAIAFDDDGQEFHRGQRTTVTQQTWDRLATGAAAAQFVFLTEPCSEGCGCG